MKKFHFSERDGAPGSVSLWLLTRVAFLLFVGAVIALLWFSHQADVDERRATLISDMLWLEQDLRFLLVRNEELLEHLGSNQRLNAVGFSAGAKTLIANNSGLKQLFWLDAAGRTQFAEPSASNAYMVGEEIDVVPSKGAFRLAGAIGKTSYSPAYPIIQDDWQFEAHVPVFVGGKFHGVVVGIYSLKHLIEKSVPWWLTERYRISVTHYDGRELVSRSSIAPLQTESEYQLNFEPPGRGLSLRAVPYRLPPALIGRVLSGALVLLAFSVLLSLWALRRHAQRRLSAETALREQFAFQKAMEDSLQTGLRARDLNGRITYVNPAFCRMVGWSADELIGRDPPMPYWADEDVSETKRVHDKILAGEGSEVGFELLFKRRNGEVFTALIHEAPLINALGEHSGWMGSMIDISDLKHAEEHARLQQERLQATARLVSMGEMASSLAHELNQPLAAISSYCTASLNLIASGSSASDVVPALARAVDQAQRAGTIVRRIYNGVRRSDGRCDVLNVQSVLDAALGLIEHDLRRQRISVHTLYLKQCSTLGDQVMLEQVIFNLLRNAADSMQDTPPENRQLTVKLDKRDGYAEISIADVGSGVSPDVSEKLFEPLFTTKVEGMGMGLSICRSVAESHRGRLWFEANLPTGSVFHLILPLTAA